MATLSSNPSSPRFSLWLRSSPSSSSESFDCEPPPPHHYRHSAMPSLFREKIQSSSQRVRAISLAKSSSRSPPSTAKPSVQQSNTPSSSLRRRAGTADNTVLGSLKGRLKRRPSAPLLSRFNSTTSEPAQSSVESPTTPTGTPPSSKLNTPWTTLESLALESWPPSRERSLKFSFRDHRKQTATPINIIDGIGVGVKLPEEDRTDDRQQNAEVDVDVITGGYRDVDWFAIKEDMKVHPYRREEAPYMQAYNRVLLENDHYTHMLLKRCNDNGTPTFHDYGSTPPSNVLDLGCGEGHWVIDAAKAWSAFGTKITGFDLVDVVGDGPTPDNVTWKRGNFVEYELPFPDETFDLVRLANFMLSIPHVRWEHVLREIKRVLTPGGRLEIIDDHMFFPYVSSALEPNSTPEHNNFRQSWGSYSSSSSQVSSTMSYQDDLMPTPDSEESGVEPGLDTPSLYTGDSPSDTDCEDLLTPTEGVLEGFDFSTPEDVNSKELPPIPDPEPNPLYSSRLLEQLFESMLKSSFGIYPRPHSFLDSFLQHIFGPEARAAKIRTFNLSLPESEACHSPITENDERKSSKAPNAREKSRNKWMPVEWDNKEKERGKMERINEKSLAQAQSEGKLSAKAARLLGVAIPAVDHPSEESIIQVNSGDQDVPDTSTVVDNSSIPLAEPSLLPTSRPSELSRLTTPVASGSTHPNKPKPYQPSGLLLYPDVLLPMSPSELEMHACKHIHTLLGCKVALGEFVQSFLNGYGERLIDDDQWETLIWQYECLRRKRFNLPDLLGMTDDDEEEDESPSATPTIASAYFKRSFGSGLSRDQKRARSGSISQEAAPTSVGTYVRAIRVFEAYKT